MWYPLGKTLAEEKAYEYVANLGPNATFDLVSMNPTWILGPLLQPTLNESSKKIYDYIIGAVALIPNAHKTLVDVRDVAKAHILAFEQKTAKGRYLLMAGSYDERDICKSILKAYPSAKVPTEASTATLPASYGPAQPAPYLFDGSKAQALGVAFRGLDEMIEGTISSLCQHGLIA